MKCFCEHHQPWFRCAVCETARAEIVAQEREMAERQRWDRDFMRRRLEGLGGCSYRSICVRIEA